MTHPLVQLYPGMITGVIAQWKGKSWSWSGSFPEQGTYHWLNAIAAGPHGRVRGRYQHQRRRSGDRQLRDGRRALERTRLELTGVLATRTRSEIE